MKNNNRVILAACFLVASLSACSSMFQPPVDVPHENFKLLMKNKIGMKYDDPPDFTGIDTEQFISSNALLNGNMENGYRYRRSCVYFLEIDPDTHKIVGWRFEGSTSDCSVAPVRHK